MGNPSIHLVKMDVDGFECQILRGARNLLSNSRPTFVLELSPYVLEEHGASVEELLSYFIPLGYRFFDERTEQLLPSEARELQSLVEDGASKNIIARAH
jgi:hypothetical protein